MRAYTIDLSTSTKSELNVCCGVPQTLREEAKHSCRTSKDSWRKEKTQPESAPWEPWSRANSVSYLCARVATAQSVGYQ